MFWGLLNHHRPDDPVAVCRSESAQDRLRSAERFATDVRRLAGHVPPRPADLAEGVDALVACEDRYHFVVAVFAAWSRGWTVALPPNVQATLLQEWQHRDDIGCLIHDVDEPTGIDLRRCLTEDVLPTTEPLVDPNTFADQRPIVAVWTSGTTGRHQRHLKTAAQLFGEAKMLAERFEIGRGHTVVATVPPHHIYGLLFSVLVPLMGGACFHRESPLHAQAVAAPLRPGLDSHKVVLVSVPAHLRVLSVLEREALAAVVRVFSSGAPLLAETAAMLRERFDRPATEILGSTETGGMAFRVQTEPGVPWHPLPGVEIEVVEGQRLAIHSPYLDPGLDQPYLSSERVRLRPDGSFEHLGRVDGVVKVGGKRIAIAEVEARLLAIPGVVDAGVCDRDAGGSRGTELLALVVAPGLGPSDIRGALSKHLDAVVVPRRLRMVDDLARDGNGKLRRSTIREHFSAPHARCVELLVEAAGEPVEDGDWLCFRGRVPRHLEALRGHFRGQPIVPGAVLLRDVARCIARAWPALGPAKQLSRVKFRSPLRPGQAFGIFVQRGAKPQVQVEVRDGPTAVASMTYVYAGEGQSRD